MSGRLIRLDPGVVAEALRGDLELIADDIAADARRGYAQHELKTSRSDMGVIVESDDDGVRVVTHNPFAHLDEWGGSDVHSTPTGAMRSAAARAGKFIPHAKGA